eukprot:gene12083-15193_t
MLASGMRGRIACDVKKAGLASARFPSQMGLIRPKAAVGRGVEWVAEERLENGTTYNSYIIYGEEKTALVDASHEKFHDLYLGTLQKQLEAASRKIDYIICSHTEPDHSGLIPAILDLYPEAVVAGSKVCLMFLKGLTHRPFTSQQVKGGDKIDLGGAHVLEFVMAPNLHWPDTMFSFDHATNIMYTCDAFGLHYCTEDPYDVDVKAIMPHYRFYYDCLMKPNAKSVTTALRKTKDLPYSIIANGHGPIIRFNVPELSTVFSDRLSQTLAKGITKAGVQTEMVDMLSCDPQELVAITGRSKGIVLMSPPNNNPEAKISLAAMTSAVKKGTKIIVAESFGGNDEPVDALVGSFVDANCDMAVDPLRMLTQKDVISKKKKAMCPDVAKAVARISSGLYVVTASHNNARSAMIASWVTQASFEPLGLTIAVAKDRAIESLMQVGDSFVLNCLGEDDFQGTMKHFLQRFQPGADRFEGVDWFPAPDNKSPVLKGSIAYMECKVVSRLETADHWITYCEVVDGNVNKPQARTAVHRRKQFRCNGAAKMYSCRQHPYVQQFRCTGAAKMPRWIKLRS